MAEQLRVYTILAEEWNLVPSFHISGLTMVPRVPRAFNSLFGPCAYLHTTHKNKINPEKIKV